MKLKYFFCRTELGELEKTDENTYVYNSDMVNEQNLLRLSEEFNASNYTLQNSQSRESTVLFHDFKELIDNFSNKNLIRASAKIDGNESDWEKLVKFAKLKYFTPTFYVQLADEENKQNSE